jgi:hypothetical protein
MCPICSSDIDSVRNTLQHCDAEDKEQLLLLLCEVHYAELFELDTPQHSVLEQLSAEENFMAAWPLQ